MIILDQLKQLAPGSTNLASFVDPLNETMERFGIDDSTEREAAFIGQLIHESGGFRTLSENLNYASTALLALWPKRFTLTLANEFGRTGDHPANQKMIANLAYCDRLGNGPVSSGDGWMFRGRGPIQITGKAHYQAAGKALGIDLASNPDLVLEPHTGCLVAGWFWDKGNSTGKSLNIHADAWNIDKISRVINGGDNGLAARRSLCEQALRIIV